MNEYKYHFDVVGDSELKELFLVVYFPTASYEGKRIRIPLPKGILEAYDCKTNTYIPEKVAKSDDHKCFVVDQSNGPCGDCDNGTEHKNEYKLKVATEKCPKCVDGYLIERVNSTTKNTFLGCSEFPDCEFTKPGGKHPSPAKIRVSQVSEPYCDCFDPWDDLYDPLYDMDPGDMF